jgi:hypothetical protein
MGIQVRVVRPDEDGSSWKIEYPHGADTFGYRIFKSPVDGQRYIFIEQKTVSARPVPEEIIDAFYFDDGVDVDAVVRDRMPEVVRDIAKSAGLEHSCGVIEVDSEGELVDTLISG